jgi:hypothetical protein
MRKQCTDLMVELVRLVDVVSLESDQNMAKMSRSS